MTTELKLYLSAALALTYVLCFGAFGIPARPPTPVRVPAGWQLAATHESAPRARAPRIRTRSS